MSSNVNSFFNFIVEDDEHQEEEEMIMPGDPRGEKKPGGRKKKEIPFKELMQRYDFLKKEPKYVKQFHKFQEEEGRTDQELKDLYHRIQAHRNTLKQQQIDLTKKEKFEEIGDELDKMQLLEQTNKFLKLIPNPLRSELRGNIALVYKLSEMIIGYSYEDYKNTFMRKVAKYKTAAEFFNALESHISSFAPKSSIFRNVEDHPGAEVVASDDDFLVARVYSKKASCDLGSQQWCISGRHGNYWGSYVVGSGGYGGRNDGFPGVQYFIWDFSFGSTHIESQIGTTLYRQGRSNTAHAKNDRSISINGKRWYKFLVNWDGLKLEQQVRYIADNPDMEGYTGVVNGLDEKTKRKLLQEIPKLLTQFKDLKFLTNDEIWSLVQRDMELTEFQPIANQLTEDQRVLCVVKNPDLLDMKWNPNPYEKITGKLTRNQRIEMISNKHELYPKFELNEEEHFLLINKDPKILVSYPVIAQRVSQKTLKEQYTKNKMKWDAEIALSKSDEKSKVELILKHLTKDDDRLDMEETNNCFIFIASKEGDKLLPTEDEGLIYIEDILDPNNRKVATPMLLASFNDELNGYTTWIPKELLSYDELDNETWIFKTSHSDLVAGKGEGKDQQIFDYIQTNHKLMR